MTQPSGSEKETAAKTVSVKTGGRKKKRVSDVPDISGVLGADASAKKPTESREKSHANRAPRRHQRGKVCVDVELIG